MNKSAVIVPAFALLSGAIAWGVLSDARASRLESLLAEIEAAETRAAYVGLREISAGETFVIKVMSAGDGRRHVESAKPRRAGGVQGLIRPGLVQWKERVKDYPLAVRNYDIVATGPERVAGREAEGYEARPRHPGRPVFRVAADRVHRLALRFEVLSPDGSRFRAEFKEIQFPSKVELPPSPPPPPAWVKVDRIDLPFGRLPVEAGFGVWAPSRLPAGFELRQSELIRVSIDLPDSTRRALPIQLPNLGGTLVHLAYTDGLAQLSLIEIDAASELWGVAKKFLPKAERSASGVLAHRVRTPGGAAYLLDVEGTAILVAGNVPAEDIEKTIESLYRR